MNYVRKRACAVGALLVVSILGVSRVIICLLKKAPPLLKSVLPGERRLYLWKLGHIFYKVTGAEQVDQQEVKAEGPVVKLQSIDQQPELLPEPCKEVIAAAESKDAVASTESDIVTQEEHAAVAPPAEVTQAEPAESSAAMPIEAYCMKCRQKRAMQEARKIVTKSGRNALEGHCPVCGTRLFRFVAR